MIASVETAWLFTRGPLSVRIVRAVSADGAIRLVVEGPGDAADTRAFEDVVTCVNFQSDLERRLVAQGYTLERFTSERRAGPGERRQRSRTERRRPR